MHYVLEVQTLFYRDMLTQIWKVINTTGGAPHGTVGGTTISWISKLQKVVALSTTKVEYVATTGASKEMI
jgi:hypothetical protein